MTQPVVLVGGLSRRFGRDKLREPVDASGAEWLVDRPLGALRAVFGSRVALVGACHPDVAVRGDLSIADRYPGVGPAGGILSALEQSAGDVFVLAGDLLHITPASVRTILEAADSAAQRDAWVVLADADGVQPCIGVYRQAVREVLSQRLRAGVASLHDLVPIARRGLVAIDTRDAVNVNTTDALD